MEEGYKVRRMERRGKGWKKTMDKEGEIGRAAPEFAGAQILFPAFPTGLLPAQSTLTCKKSL